MKNDFFSEPTEVYLKKLDDVFEYDPVSHREKFFHQE